MVRVQTGKGMWAVKTTNEILEENKDRIENSNTGHVVKRLSESRKRLLAFKWCNNWGVLNLT